MNAQTFPSLTAPAWPARTMRIGLWLIGIGLLLVVLSGPLNRFGLVSFGPALLTLAAGLLLLIAGALVTLVGFLVAISRRVPVPRLPAAVGVIVALVAIGYLLTWVQRGRGAPPIHEVSTDLTSPPEFAAIREVRERIPGINPTDYVAKVRGPGGAMLDVPALQKKFYPDIQPLKLNVPPDEALQRAERVAHQLHWDVVSLSPSEQRLEATDTTLFFGFKDDIVVRVRPDGSGSRVDVRSKSRVGLGDAGTNAARLRKFLQLMQNE